MEGLLGGINGASSCSSVSESGKVTSVDTSQTEVRGERGKGLLPLLIEFLGGSKGATSSPDG